MPWWEPYESHADRIGVSGWKPAPLAPLEPEKPARPRPGPPLTRRPEPEPLVLAPERRSLLRDALHTVLGVWGLLR